MSVNKILVNNNDSNYTHSIFDISEYTGHQYSTLSDALNAIPQAKQKGGMTIRYVQTNDNQYVQYRLMNTGWSTAESDWQRQGAEANAYTRHTTLNIDDKNVDVANSNNLEYIDSMIGYELKKTDAKHGLNVFNDLTIKTGDILLIKVTNVTGYSRIVINYNNRWDKQICDTNITTSFVDNWLRYVAIENIYQFGMSLSGVETASLYIRKVSTDDMPHANIENPVTSDGIYDYIKKLVGFKYQSKYITSPNQRLIQNLEIKQGEKIALCVLCESYTRIIINYNNSTDNRLTDTEQRTDFINDFIEVVAPTDINTLGLYVSGATAKLVVQQLNYDNEPIKDSFNLVKSGGVFNSINNIESQFKNLVGIYNEGTFVSGTGVSNVHLIPNISILQGETFFLKVIIGDYTRYIVNYNGSTDKRLLDTNNAVVAENEWAEFKAPVNISELGIFVSGITQNVTLCFAKVKPTLVKNTDVLSKKKWYVCGDSFSWSSWNSHTNDNTFIDEPYKDRFKIYPYWIGRRVDIEIHNLAYGGMSMCANRSDGTDNSFTASGTEHHTIPLYQTIPADADIITLYFGINDNNYGCPLGEWGDTTNQTFYGAWKLALDWLVENRPNAKIGIVITNGSAPRFTNAERIIAKKYGIPYLDMELDTERVPYLLRQHERTVSGGGDMLDSVAAAKDEEHAVDWGTNNHPTAKCHELESTFIENWLRTL